MASRKVGSTRKQVCTGRQSCGPRGVHVSGIPVRMYCVHQLQVKPRVYNLLKIRRAVMGLLHADDRADKGDAAAIWAVQLPVAVSVTSLRFYPQQSNSGANIAATKTHECIHLFV
jgi:hypothetical protein